ncbi:MAG: PAS domain S-box protein, partial [Chroococcales cyanobacterium]
MSFQDSSVPFRCRQSKASVEQIDEHILDQQCSQNCEFFLSQSEDFFEQLLNHLPETILLTNDTGDFTFISSNVEKTLGYSIEDVTALGNITCLFGANKINLDEFDKFGIIENVEVEITSKCGQRRVLLINGKRVSLKQGTYLYSCRNITLRKQQEEALTVAYQALANQVAQQTVQLEEELIQHQQIAATLKETECQLQAQYKGIPIPTYTWRKLGQELVLVDYNDAAEHFTQGQVLDWIGKTSRDIELIVPETGQNLWHCFSHQTSFKREISYCLPCPKKTKHLAVTYVFVPPDLVTVHTEDITERKIAEEALLNSEKRYRTLAEHFPNGSVCLFDRELRYILADGTGLAEVGLSKELLEGNTIWEVFPPEVCARIEPDYRAALAGKATTSEVSFADQIYLTQTIPLFNEATEVYGGMVMIQKITERKQAEAELLESEQRFRATFEQAAVGIAHVGLGGEFVRINEGFCELLGYSHNELFGKSFIDVTHPDEIEQDLQCLSQLLAGKIKIFSREKRYRRKDGSMMWGNVTVSLVYETSGKPDYFVAVLEDISERKRVETERDRFFNHSFDLMSIVSFDSGLKLINPAWEKTLGFSSEELIGHDFYEFIHPDDWQATEQAFGKLATGTPLLQFENRHRCKDGSYKWLSWNAFPVPEEGIVYGFARDITERKQAQSERDRIFNLSLDLLGVCSFDGYFRRVNPAVETILGYTPEQFLSIPFLQLIHPQDQRATLAEIKKLSTGNPSLYFESRYQCQDGSYKWLAWSALPVPQEELIYVVARNITPNKQAEFALKQLLQRERLMVKIQEKIRQSLELNEILQATVEEVRQDLKSDRVLIYQLCPDSSGTVVKESVGPHWISLQGRTLTDCCFIHPYTNLSQEAPVQAIQDIYDANLSPSSVELLAQFQVRATLIIPLV